MSYANKMRKDSIEREAKTQEMLDQEGKKRKTGPGMGIEQLETLKKETEEIE